MTMCFWVCSIYPTSIFSSSEIFTYGWPDGRGRAKILLDFLMSERSKPVPWDFRKESSKAPKRASIVNRCKEQLNTNDMGIKGLAKLLSEEAPEVRKTLGLDLYVSLSGECFLLFFLTDKCILIVYISILSPLKRFLSPLSMGVKLPLMQVWQFISFSL